MQYLVYSGFAGAVLLVCGLPFAFVLLPAHLRRMSLPAAPLLGYCYIVTVCYPIYRLNIGGTDLYALWLLVPPILLLLVLLIRRRLKAGLLPDRDAWTMVGLAILSFAALSLLFVLSDGRAVSMAISNHDVVELAGVSRFLQEFPRDTTVGFMGQSNEMILNADDIWFGPSIIAAVISSLAHSEPFRLQTLLLVVLTAQGAAFVFALARKTLSLNYPTAVAVGALYAVNPVIMFAVWQSFGGQVVATSLALFSIFLITYAQNERADLKTQIRYLPPIVLLWCGLLVTYHFMILILCVLAGCYILVVAIAERSRQRITSAVMLMIGVLLLIAAIDPIRIPAVLRTFAMVASGSSGWFMPWLSPALQLGFNTSNAFTGMAALTGPLGIVVAVALAAAAAWTVYRFRDRTPLAAFAIGLFLPAFAAGLYYAISEQEGGVLGSYRSFKMTSTFVSFTLVAFALWFGVRSMPRDKFATVAGAVLAAGLLIVNGMQVNDLFVFARAHAYVPSDELRKIKAIEKMDFVTGINILDDTNFDLQWAEYFTLHKRQVYQRFVYTGRAVGPLTEAYNLQRNETASAGEHDDIFVAAKPKCAEVWPINNRLSLCKPVAPFDVTVKEGKGWWDQEPGHRWSGRTGRSAEVDIQVGSPRVQAVFKASHGPLRPGDAVTLAVNGRAVPLKTAATEFVSEPFVLEPGRNVATLTQKLDPSGPTASDGRTLGILWNRIAVEGAGPSIEPPPTVR